MNFAYTPCSTSNFNPRSPCGERPNLLGTWWCRCIFQSTLPVWGATSWPPRPQRSPAISIHAPRVGSDATSKRSAWCCRISIHAPRVGSDHDRQRPPSPGGYFNPRSPCGERLHLCRYDSPSRHISIHAPRVGSDAMIISHLSNQKISIHAPRVGSDNRSYIALWEPGYFNPRSPCGERPLSAVRPVVPGVFQSTLPVWGATGMVPLISSPVAISIHAPRVGSDHVNHVPAVLALGISIHAPRVGSDCNRLFSSMLRRAFQSTLPVWGATSVHVSDRGGGGISIHAPRVGSDVRRGDDNVPLGKFQSTLPVWGATLANNKDYASYVFQSTLPVWGATKTVSVNRLST